VGFVDAGAVGTTGAAAGCCAGSVVVAAGVALPVEIGRAFVERRMGAAADSEVGAGTLFSSGLIAGGSLMSARCRRTLRRSGSASRCSRCRRP